MKKINLNWVIVGLVVVVILMLVVREGFESGDSMPTVSSASYTLGTSGSKSTATATVSAPLTCSGVDKCGVLVSIYGKGPDGQYSKDPIDQGWSTSASGSTYTMQMVSDPTYVSGFTDRYGIAQTFKTSNLNPTSGPGSGSGGIMGPEYKFSA